MTNEIIQLFIYSLVIACIAWTVTHEEIFREARDYCANQASTSKSFFRKKFFYVFTCEYCFSHWVTMLFLLLTGYKLILHDWRGYIISGFSLVFIANIYMTIFALLRQGLKKERIEASIKDEELREIKEENR